MSLAIWVFLAVWMIVFIPTGLGAVQTGQELLHQGTSDALPLAPALPGFMVFPNPLAAADTLLARADQETLLRFLRTTVVSGIEPSPN